MAVLFSFFENPLYYFPVWLHQFSFPPKVYRVFFCPHSHQHFLFLDLLIIATLTSLRWYLTVSLICIPVMISDVGQLFTHLLFICIFWGICIFNYSIHLNWTCIYLLIYLFICLFIFIISFDVQNIFSLVIYHLPFSFIAFIFINNSKKIIFKTNVKKLNPYVFF